MSVQRVLEEVHLSLYRGPKNSNPITAHHEDAAPCRARLPAPSSDSSATCSQSAQLPPCTAPSALRRLASSACGSTGQITHAVANCQRHQQQLLVHCSGSASPPDAITVCCRSLTRSASCLPGLQATPTSKRWQVPQQCCRDMTNLPISFGCMSTKQRQLFRTLEGAVHGSPAKTVPVPVPSQQVPGSRPWINPAGSAPGSAANSAWARVCAAQGAAGAGARPNARVSSPRAVQPEAPGAGAPALGDPRSRLAQSALPWEPCDDELGSAG